MEHRNTIVARRNRPRSHAAAPQPRQAALRHWRVALCSSVAVAASVSAEQWPAGTYRCNVEAAVGIQLRQDGTIAGPVKPEPAQFTLELAPLVAECGDISVAHTTVGIALRCTEGSSTAKIDDALGGMLYQWAFPGPTFINVQGTTMLQLGREDAIFMWSFVLPDYASVYQGRCAILENR